MLHLGFERAGFTSLDFNPDLNYDNVLLGDAVMFGSRANFNDSLAGIV